MSWGTMSDLVMSPLLGLDTEMPCGSNGRVSGYQFEVARAPAGQEASVRVTAPHAATPFGYTGGYTDPTGLVYLINRYYDPQAGQFISVDPDLSQTVQPYGYANGNPVSATDPTGQWACTQTNSWSSTRRCLAYISERQIHNVELGFGLLGGGVGGSLTAAGFAAVRRMALAELCADAIPACMIVGAIFGAIAAYVYWNDYGNGEYLEFAEWRFVTAYISNFTWYGSVTWSAWDGWWIPYAVWLQGIY